MKKIIIFSILFIPPFAVFAQGGFINNGAALRVENNAFLRIANSPMSNQNGGTISNNGEIYLEGDFSQHTAATYSGTATSALVFEGSSTQQLVGDVPITIPRIRINNSNNLLLQQHLQAETEVNLMNNSSIVLNGFNLSTANGNIINYDETHYIKTNNNGSLQRSMNSGDVKTYPVGNSHYNPVEISNTGDSDDFSVRVEDAVLENGNSGAALSAGAVNCTWHISESLAGGSFCDISVEWAASQELSSFDRMNCGLAHWNGILWEHPAGMSAATNTSGTRWKQSSTGQTSFSPFAIEDSGLDLPIELLRFDAVRTNANEVKLDWATGSEIDNAGFEVLRMLDNETEFRKVGFIDGYGNSSSLVNYGFHDNNAYSKVSYYRLRQLDYDGKESFSDIRAVSGLDDHDMPILLYPNPAKNNVYIRFGDLQTSHQSARVRLFDMRGALLEEMTVGVAAYQSFSLDTKELEHGCYLVEIYMNTGEQQIFRFIKE